MAEGGEHFVKKMCFSSSENLAASWKLFKSQLRIYMIAKKFSDMSEEEKIANALLLMGSESVPIYDQFVFNEDVPAERKTLENVLTMFGKHCEPVKNITYERVKFNSMKQGEMSIHQFITTLQSQADVCEYGQMRDELVRDRIVVGVRDMKLREYLIDVENLTLSSCIQKAKQYISHHEQIKKMDESVDENLDDVHHKSKQSNSKTAASSGFVKTCPFCNKQPHHRTKCPARFSICHACKVKGHWAKSRACKGKTTQTPTRNEEVSEQTTESGVEGLYLGSESD